MPKKPIYLIDLAHKSKLGLSSDTMPLQLGLVGAHCLAQHGDRVEVEMFKFIDDFENALKRQAPFIVGLSSYIWNIDLNYKAIQ